MDERKISKAVHRAHNVLVKQTKIIPTIASLRNPLTFYKECGHYGLDLYYASKPSLAALLKSVLFQTYGYRVLTESGDGFFDFSKIRDTFRDHDFFKKRENVKSSNHERPMCYTLLTKDQAFHNFPIRLIDREVPLNKYRNSNKGKVDLVGYDEIKNRIVLIEAKIPNSDEPLIRAISEIVTYSNQINKECFVKDFNRFTGKSVDPSSPFELMIMTGEGPYRLAPNCILDLIKKYDITPYIFKSHIWDINDIESMIPLKVTESQIEDFKTYKHFLCGNNQKENFLPYYDYIEKEMDRLCREIDERIGR